MEVERRSGGGTKGKIITGEREGEYLHGCGRGTRRFVLKDRKLRKTDRIKKSPSTLPQARLLVNSKARELELPKVITDEMFQLNSWVE